jgi:hypothetical protein
VTAPPWWAAVAPAEGELACSGATHRLRWEAGHLQLLDHADAAAEATLAALGGDPPACVAVRDRWARYGTDVALVTLGRRPGEATFGFAPERPAGAPRPAPSPSARARARLEATSAGRRAALLQLLQLPLPLVDRLVLGAIDAAAERWSDDDFRTAHGLRLGAALAARAAPAFTRAGARVVDGPDVSVHVQCAPTAPGQPPSIRAERRTDGLHVAASLPLRWLSAVWGAGISEVGDDVVLGVVGVSGDSLDVEVGRWEDEALVGWRMAAERRSLRRDGDGFWRPA